MKDIRESSTLTLNALAKQVRQSGVDVVNLTAGELDSATPEWIIEAAKQALSNGETKYAPSGGLPKLRSAIATWATVAYQHAIDCEQVVVTNGAKQALFNIFQLLLEPGDEVIIPKPYWLSYPPMVTIPGGRPVYLERRAADHYILDADAAKPLITPRTRAIIINSPCNPTGVVHDLTSLQAIAKLAEKHNLICIFDDIYQQLTFDGRRWISPYVLKDIDPRRIIAVSGVSKSYAMTGFRIGWAIAAKEWSQSLAALQSHSTSSPATPSQWAAYAALSGPQDCIEQTRLSLQTKRDLVVATLPRLANIGCNPIQGAFYALLDCQAVLGSGRRWPDAHSLAMQLLEKAHVALVPGNDFGAPFALRLSFATSKENLTKGLERLVDWF